jgi:hypothetical protein
MEHYGHDVNDKSCKLPGGMQRIKTADGYLIPLSIVNGLPRLAMRPPTARELETLPHIILTAPEGEFLWDPTVLDFDPPAEDEQWFDAVEAREHHPYHELFDEFGNYKRRVVAEMAALAERSGGLTDTIDCFMVHCNQDIVPKTVDTDSDSEDEDTPQVSSTWMVHEEELHYFDAVDEPEDLPKFIGRPMSPAPNSPPPPPEPPPEQPTFLQKKQTRPGKSHTRNC